VLMDNLLRLLILMAAALVGATAMLPFDHPLDVNLPLNGPPPRWLVGFLCLVLTFAAAIPAAIGLILFRKWARALGALVAVAALVGAATAFQSPIAGAAGSQIMAMLASGILAWCCGVGLSFHPAVAGRFRA